MPPHYKGRHWGGVTPYYPPLLEPPCHPPPHYCLLLCAKRVLSLVSFSIKIMRFWSKKQKRVCVCVCGRRLPPPPYHSHRPPNVIYWGRGGFFHPPTPPPQCTPLLSPSIPVPPISGEGTSGGGVPGCPPKHSAATQKMEQRRPQPREPRLCAVPGASLLLG